MLTNPPQEAAEATPPTAPTRAPRKQPIPGTLPNRQRRDHLEWQQTVRFVEEIHRLEEEGRCEGRDVVERRLLLPVGGVATMRAGELRVPSSAIQLLKSEYNGDWQYVLLGVRDEERSGYMRAGRDLRKAEGCRPYTHAYKHRYKHSGPDLRQKAGLPALPKEPGTKKADA